VDIAKFKHVARAQDFKGIEFGSPCYFDNSKEEFEHFLNWITEIKNEQSKDNVVVGMEPTGHYWFNLAHALKENGIKFVAVNPLHVKKSKELDDNSPTKYDAKDAKVIAQLVKDGQYAEPTIPQGVYTELSVAKKIRDLLTEDLQTVQGQVHNWIDRYFPEFLMVFKKWEGKAALQFLRLYALPHEIVNITDQELLSHLRKTVTRSVGISKIRQLKQAVRQSIGLRHGSEMAKLELKTLLEIFFKNV
jgi:transposase